LLICFHPWTEECLAWGWADLVGRLDSTTSLWQWLRLPRLSKLKRT